MSDTTMKLFKRRITILFAVVLSCVLILSAWSIWTERNHLLSDAERTTLGFAKALSEHAESSLAESDRILQDIIHDLSVELASKPDKRELFDMIKRLSGGSPQVGMAFFVNRHGQLYLNSNEYPPKQVYVGDREYFQQYKNKPETELYISNPLFSRLVSRWRFNLMRPVRNPSGEIEQLAAVAFNTDYFKQFLVPEILGSKGRLLLIRTDGVPIVNEPLEQGGYDFNFSNTTLFTKLLPKSPSGTFTLEEGVIHKEPRIVSYHKLERFQIVAVVSLSKNEVLAEWYKKTIFHITLILVLSILGCILLALLFRHLDRLHSSQQTVALQKEQLDARLAILEDIATGVNLNDILIRIARMVEEESDGAVCSVLLVDDSGHRLLHGVAPGLPDDYNQAVNGLKIGPGMGSCGTAAHSRQRVVVDDIENHPYWKGFKPARQAELKACWSEPIIAPSRELVGTFALYFRETRSPVPEEETLMETAAHLAGIAIGRVKEENDRKTLEDQLLHVQKIEAIGQLAGGVAHDFNNLLTPILVYADMVQHKLSSNDALRSKMEGILLAAHKAKDLTQKLLTFGRKQQLCAEQHDINDIISSLMDIIKRTIRENISITSNLSTNPAMIQADRGQIEQILLNLSINAQDAIGNQGTISIETGHVILDNEYVRLHPGLAPGRYILLSFKDSGCGMSDEVLKHIFEPFYTTKPVGHGTGLGLATVYGIVQQHKGHIMVESHIGHGTTFFIYLPESNSTDLPISVRESISITQSWHDNKPKNLSVLLVEDNDMVRDATKAMLEQLGYVVTAMHDPLAALEYARESTHHIDLLISDIIMPSMNGQELFGAISELRQNLPVVFVSGYTKDLIVHHGTLEEGPQFLQKPFTAEQLIRKIQTTLN